MAVFPIKKGHYGRLSGSDRLRVKRAAVLMLENSESVLLNLSKPGSKVMLSAPEAGRLSLGATPACTDRVFWHGYCFRVDKYTSTELSERKPVRHSGNPLAGIQPHTESAGLESG